MPFKSTFVFSLMDIIKHALPETVSPVVTNQQDKLDQRTIDVLLQKIDLRLMPLLILLDIFNYLIRISIGNKKI
jgi:hypothetical protein